MARPTKYNDEVLEKARDYIENHEQYDDLVPSVVGLAGAIDVSRSTLYKWGEENDEFSDILDRINEDQERKLLSGGLGGDFNSNIVKLMLGKHGYSDKHDVSAKADIVINVRADGFGRFGGGQVNTNTA